MQALTVYDITDTTFEPVAELGDTTSWTWEESYVGAGDVEVWVPLTTDNAALLRNGIYLWDGESSAAIISSVKQDEEDESKIDIKGSTIESLLSRRIVPVTYTSTNKPVSDIMRDIVQSNCINPSDVKRKITYLELGSGGGLGPQITYQSTGDTVYDALVDLASSHGLGFNVVFDPRGKRFVFEVTQGVDRSIDQDAVDPIELSTDTEDLLTSTYSRIDDDYRNVALVAGEGEGSSRVTRWSGDTNASGLDRVELYIDARDIQKESTDADGEQVTMTNEQYNEALDQRGAEKLSECVVYESFESAIRIDGMSQYVYGRDYMLGDTVTVTNSRMLVRVPATVTAVTKSYGESYSVDIAFGFLSPTIMGKMKQLARR